MSKRQKNLGKDEDDCAGVSKCLQSEPITGRAAGNSKKSQKNLANWFFSSNGQENFFAKVKVKNDDH